MMLSQKQQVYARLKQATNGVCATVFLDRHIPRVAARICELRNDGHRIVTEPCTDRHHGHRTRQVQYRLEDTP